jgi:hypothetical protein
VVVNGSEIELSPDVLGRMQTLRDQGFKHFREIVLVGGRRCSKGFVTGLSLAKKMYDTLQLQDPGRHYGIDVDKEICFSCVAASLDQAKDTQYADFSSMVNSCFAMQRYIHKVQHLEFSVATESDLRKLESWKRQKRVVERDISKLRGKALPANARTIRGSATMALVFDEFAHFQQGESDQADSQVYAAAKPSLAQFGRDALIFCNSSPYSKVGTFFERYETGMATDNGAPENPEVLTYASLLGALRGLVGGPDLQGSAEVHHGLTGLGSGREEGRWQRLLHRRRPRADLPTAPGGAERSGQVQGRDPWSVLRGRGRLSHARDGGPHVRRSPGSLG